MRVWIETRYKLNIYLCLAVTLYVRVWIETSDKPLMIRINMSPST